MWPCTAHQGGAYEGDGVAGLPSCNFLEAASAGLASPWVVAIRTDGDGGPQLGPAVAREGVVSVGGGGGGWGGGGGGGGGGRGGGGPNPGGLEPPPAGAGGGRLPGGRVDAG